MEKETHIVTYGVKKGYNNGKKRYFVMCDGRISSLHYAKKDFALKQAYNFCKECHKDFVRSRDNKLIHFVYKHTMTNEIQ